MNSELVYLTVNYAVLPFWLLLAILPNHRMTRVLVHSGLIPLLLGVVYVVALVLGDPDPSASGTTLPGVLRLFDDPWVMIAGWTHYLIFDLFVAAWQVRDARRRAIPHLAVVPGLFGTLMFGPVGLLWYLALRLMLRRTVLLEEV